MSKWLSVRYEICDNLCHSFVIKLYFPLCNFCTCSCFAGWKNLPSCMMSSRMSETNVWTSFRPAHRKQLRWGRRSKYSRMKLRFCVLLCPRKRGRFSDMWPGLTGSPHREVSMTCGLGWQVLLTGRSLWHVAWTDRSSSQGGLYDMWPGLTGPPHREVSMTCGLGWQVLLTGRSLWHVAWADRSSSQGGLYDMWPGLTGPPHRPEVFIGITWPLASILIAKTISWVSGPHPCGSFRPKPKLELQNLE